MRRDNVNVEIISSKGSVFNGTSVVLQWVVFNFLSAFTLAEVLITLGIIGVIAALTIPTLMKTYQNQVFTQQLKESYSIVSQVANRIKADNGNTLLGAFTSCGANPCEQSVIDTDFNLFLNYMQTSKVCYGSANSLGVCYPSNIKTLLGTTSPSYFQANTINNNTPMDSAVLANGAIFAMTSYHFGPWSWTATCTGGDAPNACINFILDVNGLSQPNTMGRDIFALSIDPDGKVLPNQIGQPCNSTTDSSGNGWGCFGVIQQAGWQMNY